MVRAVLAWMQRPPAWVWPSILLALGLTSLVAALVLQPGADGYCTVFGHRFGGECAFTVATGQACPQCGMTRAFVWGARGHLVKAFWYNPAGVTLFLWLQAAGVVGLVRLIRGPRALSPPPLLLAAWTVFWLIGLYALPWVLRLFGVNPLPG